MYIKKTVELYFVSSELFDACQFISEYCFVLMQDGLTAYCLF